MTETLRSISGESHRYLIPKGWRVSSSPNQPQQVLTPKPTKGLFKRRQRAIASTIVLNPIELADYIGSERRHIDVLNTQSVLGMRPVLVDASLTHQQVPTRRVVFSGFHNDHAFEQWMWHLDFGSVALEIVTTASPGHIDSAVEAAKQIVDSIQVDWTTSAGNNGPSVHSGPRAPQLSDSLRKIVDADPSIQVLEQPPVIPLGESSDMANNDWTCGSGISMSYAAFKLAQDMARDIQFEGLPTRFAADALKELQAIGLAEGRALTHLGRKLLLAVDGDPHGVGSYESATFRSILSVYIHGQEATLCDMREVHATAPDEQPIRTATLASMPSAAVCVALLRWFDLTPAWLMEPAFEVELRELDAMVSGLPERMAEVRPQMTAKGIPAEMLAGPWYAHSMEFPGHGASAKWINTDQPGGFWVAVADTPHGMTVLAGSIFDFYRQWAGVIESMARESR
ncbi:hypothetical protein [Kocuria sp.]|uniref:hypothetical protein n=1 Tax=Kocuria sp. TaxID=1871328 RepID=UPI0026DF7745|nr:hypothetical protein [Kocuria sp.]MDO5617156.1 hypothetical protein [Kocuria sp.]